MPISPKGLFTISGPGWNITPNDMKKDIIEKLFIHARAMARMRLIATAQRTVSFAAIYATKLELTLTLRQYDIKICISSTNGVLSSYQPYHDDVNIVYVWALWYEYPGKA